MFICLWKSSEMVLNGLAPIFHPWRIFESLSERFVWAIWRETFQRTWKAKLDKRFVNSLQICEKNPWLMMLKAISVILLESLIPYLGKILSNSKKFKHWMNPGEMFKIISEPICGGIVQELFEEWVDILPVRSKT